MNPYELTGPPNQRLYGQLVKSTFSNGQWSDTPLEPLCSYRGDTEKAPVPIILSVSVFPNNYVSSQIPTVSRGYLFSPYSAAAPTYTWNNSNFRGRLHLKYTTQGNVIEADMDVVTGSYQLPPCHECEVSVAFYGGGSQGVSVAASLAAGIHPYPRRATFSGARENFGGGAFSNFFEPPPFTESIQIGWVLPVAPALQDITAVIDGGYAMQYLDFNTPTLVPPMVEFPAMVGYDLVQLQKAGADDVIWWLTCVLAL